MNQMIVYGSVALFLYVAWILWKSGHAILALLVAAGQAFGIYTMMTAQAS